MFKENGQEWERLSKYLMHLLTIWIKRGGDQIEHEYLGGDNYEGDFEAHDWLYE